MLLPYRVFISSTFLDNVERRNRISLIIQQLGMVPVGLEWLGADVRPTVEYVLQVVRSSDVVLGLLGHRYGWIPPGLDRSITELELREASELLVFIISPSIPYRDADRDCGEMDEVLRKQLLLHELKEWVKRKSTCAEFTPESLDHMVYLTLRQWKENKDGPSPMHPPRLAPQVRADEEHEAGFVGREKELEALSAEFDAFVNSSGGPFFVAISGPGGVGKTRLAREFVESLGDKLSRPPLVGDAAGESIEAAIITIAENRAVAQDSEGRRAFAMSVLQEVPEGTILVLDGIGSWEGISSLAAMSRHVFVLLLTQLFEPEKVFAFRRWLPLGDLSPEDAVRFLRNACVPDELARHVAPQLAARGMGSPFWLNATCKVLRQLVPDPESGEFRAILDQVIQKIDEAQESERVFGIAFDKLASDDQIRRLLLSLGLFAPGAIDLDYAATVADLPEGLSREAARRALRQWGFVAFGDGSTRDRVHAIVHSFLNRRLERAAESERRDLQARFASMWLDLLTKSDEMQVWREHLNVTRALGIVSESPDEDSFANGIRRLGSKELRVIGAAVPPDPALRFFLHVLRHPTNPEKTASLYLLLAEAFQRRRQLRKAEDFIQASLGIFERIGDRSGKANALKRLGYVLGLLEQTAAAEDALSEAHAIYESDDMPLEMGNVCRTLAQALLRAGDYERAAVWSSRAVGTLQATHDQAEHAQYEINTALAYALSIRGRSHLALGRGDAALADLERARDIHEAEVGPRHYYVAYDRLALAKARVRTGNIAAARRDLLLALDTYLAFFGPSVPVATVQLELAETWLRTASPPSESDLREAEARANLAETALERIPGSDAKTQARVAMLRAKVAHARNRPSDALEHVRRAEQALTSASREAAPRHRIGPQHLKATVLLEQGETDRAVQVLWATRCLCIGAARRGDLEKTDSMLKRAIVSRGCATWDASSEAYEQYIERFPDSLHHRLAHSLAKGLQQGGPDRGLALDLLCGTGLVARELHAIGGGRKILGADGSVKMLSLARDRTKGMPESYQPDFCHIHDLASYVERGSVRDVTVNMGFFQIDERERYFLFGRLLPFLADDCRVGLTSYSADFEFPPQTVLEYVDANRTNDFKRELFEQWRDRGMPGPVEDWTRPVFPKETLDSLRWFFEFHGFELAADPSRLDILVVRRTWAERVAFTRIPVIATKVFGAIPDARLWDVLEEPEGYCDTTYGVTFVTRRTLSFDPPRVYSHALVDIPRSDRVRHAVSAVIRDGSGRVLFLRRGPAACDFQGAWSLPSTEARRGRGLWGSLLESLAEHAGIKEIGAPRPAAVRFAPRGEVTLIMCVFEVCMDRDQDILLQTQKYDDYRWADPSFVNTLPKASLGECTRSLSDLLREGRLDT